MILKQLIPTAQPKEIPAKPHPRWRSTLGFALSRLTHTSAGVRLSGRFGRAAPGSRAIGLADGDLGEPRVVVCPFPHRAHTR